MYPYASIKNIHPLRSFFSDEMLTPPDWVKEFEELAYDENTILEAVKMYELYLAIIFSNTCFNKRYTQITDLAIKIMKKSESTIKNHVRNTMFIENYKKSKMYLFEGIDGSKYCEDYFKFSDMLIKHCFYPKKKCSYYYPSRNFFKGIEFSGKCVDFSEKEIIEITYLFNYLSRIKCKIQNRNDYGKANRQIMNNMSKNIIFALIQNNNNEIFSVSYDKEQLNRIEEETKKISYNIVEIKKLYNNLSLDFKENNPKKLWMLARHPEFIPYLEAMIRLDYIKDIPENYLWNYPNLTNKDGKNMAKRKLVYAICKFCDLNKWASTSKSKDEETLYRGIFTKRVFEPFNIAFAMQELENNTIDYKEKQSDSMEEFLNEVENEKKNCKKTSPNSK